MVEDELLARLKTVAGASAAFNDDPPRGAPGPLPYITLHHISTSSEGSVNGELSGDTDRWQVSVRGSNRSRVRAVASAVRDALHGYTSDTISWCGFESWPGTIREDNKGASPEYHAPLDFLVQH